MYLVPTRPARELPPAPWQQQSQAAAEGFDGVLFVASADAPGGHDCLTKASLAASLARWFGLELTPSHGSRRLPQRPYVVPCETLTSAQAGVLGVRHAHQLFGGVVPQPFVATKAITHGLVHKHAQAPRHWSPAFGAAVQPVVLDGFTAFAAEDARVALARLLPSGPVRVKDCCGVGGSGQWVVRNPQALEAVLAALPIGHLETHGIVLEGNLQQVRTISVGQVRVGDWLLSYHGEQRLTRNNHGHEVYGGSTLHLVRGDFEALLRTTHGQQLRTAVEQALAYHRAATRLFEGLFASRCNYDVVQGIDAAGVWRSGVLEQSWRIGGASGAELAALQALRDHPHAPWIDASTHEVYGATAAAPPDAQVHFDGVDPRVGRLMKYATVDAIGGHVHT